MYQSTQFISVYQKRFFFSSAQIVVFFFNGISMAKAIMVEEQYWFYLIHSQEIRRVHTFPKDFGPQMNVVVREKFELTYYDVTVEYVSHYATATPLILWKFTRNISRNFYGFGSWCYV